MEDEANLTIDLRYDILCHSLFLKRAMEDPRLANLVETEWVTDRPSFLDRLDRLDGLEMVVTKTDGPDTIEAAIFYLEGCLTLLQTWRNKVFLYMAGDHERCRAVEQKLMKILPPAELGPRVPINFWYWTHHHGFAKNVTRLLQVPAWDEIAGNYPTHTRAQLERLIRNGVEPSAGQLLLWFGEPGCGKTYALRALLREWQDRFSLHYISDTETFFSNGEYMLSVMLTEDVNRWQLFILEDAGEFLVPDARQQMGQGLSRLLNASDGLIGQGLKSMFLITTNEPTSKLHPAISRPGRCAAQIEFGTFDRAEATEWLFRHGSDNGLLAEGTRLADLFALTRGDRVDRRPVKVGF